MQRDAPPGHLREWAVRVRLVIFKGRGNQVSWVRPAEGFASAPGEQEVCSAAWVDQPVKERKTEQNETRDSILYVCTSVYTYLCICTYNAYAKQSCVLLKTTCTRTYSRTHTKQITLGGVEWAWEQGLETKRKIREGPYIYR